MSLRFCCVLILTLTAGHAAAMGVLDIDFGQGGSAVQPGFTDAFGSVFPSASGATLVIVAVDGQPIDRFFEPAANQGPLGALVSDGILLPDDFVASTQGVTFGVGYTVDGLDPGEAYDLTFFTPPQEGLNNVDARGAGEGVLTASPAFPGFINFRVTPDASGQVSGSVDSATGISFWSGLSVRLAVPEPSAALVGLIGLIGVSIRGDRR